MFECTYISQLFITLKKTAIHIHVFVLSCIYGSQTFAITRANSSESVTSFNCLLAFQLFFLLDLFFSPRIDFLYMRIKKRKKKRLFQVVVEQFRGSFNWFARFCNRELLVKHPEQLMHLELVIQRINFEKYLKRATLVFVLLYVTLL